MRSGSASSARLVLYGVLLGVLVAESRHVARDVRQRLKRRRWERLMAEYAEGGWIS